MPFSLGLPMGLSRSQPPDSLLELTRADVENAGPGAFGLRIAGGGSGAVLCFCMAKLCARRSSIDLADFVELPERERGGSA